VEVARSLLTKSSARSSAGELAVKNALDRRVADALDIIVAEIAIEHIDQNAEQRHAKHVPKVAAGYLVK
jgi:hypothetical protein